MIITRNIGKRPATNTTMKIAIVDKQLQKTSFSTEYPIINDVPPNNPTPYYNDSLQLGTNVPAQFIVMEINYEDTLDKKKYTQTYYMKWEGVTNGTTHPDFTHLTSLEDKE